MSPTFLECVDDPDDVWVIERAQHIALTQETLDTLLVFTEYVVLEPFDCDSLSGISVNPLIDLTDATLPDQADQFKTIGDDSRCFHSSPNSSTLSILMINADQRGLQTIL